MGETIVEVLVFYMNYLYVMCPNCKVRLNKFLWDNTNPIKIHYLSRSILWSVQSGLNTVTAAIVHSVIYIFKYIICN
jgi:hypothetical protein